MSLCDYQTEALEREAMQEVLQARRDARQALQTAREQEQQLLRQQEEGRRVWYQELKTRAQEARRVSHAEGGGEYGVSCAVCVSGACRGEGRGAGE